MNTASRRFEHKVVEISLKLFMKDMPKTIETTLNEAGRSGWELVAKIDNPMNGRLLFLMKRRVA